MHRGAQTRGRSVTATRRVTVVAVICDVVARRTDVCLTCVGETEEELVALTTMIKDGTITPAVDGVYPMEQAAAAARKDRNRTAIGIGCRFSG